MPNSKPVKVPEEDASEPGFSASEKPTVYFHYNKSNLSGSEKYEESVGRLLSAYEIGAKLRRLRLRKKLGLVDLGKHTGLSASLLSQLENGKVTPTLPTLARIAMVFDIGLDYFFDDQRSKRVFAVTRKNDRLRFPDRPDNPVPAYYFEVLAFSAKEKRVSAYVAEFPQRSPEEVREHFHEGWELVHVLSGSLVIRFEAEDHLLEVGDSAYFDALEPHAYRGESDPPAQALVVTTQSPL